MIRTVKNMHKNMHRHHTDVFSEVHIVVSVLFLTAVSLVQEKKVSILLCTEIEHKTNCKYKYLYFDDRT